MLFSFVSELFSICFLEGLVVGSNILLVSGVCQILQKI